MDFTQLMPHCVLRKLGISKNKGTLSQALYLEKLDNLAMASRPVGECDINSDGSQFGVDITWWLWQKWKCSLLHSTMIANCWLHLTSSFVCSAMVGWLWGAVALDALTLADSCLFVTVKAKCNAHMYVPLSPSSIIWYRLMSGDALWLGR